MRRKDLDELSKLAVPFFQELSLIGKDYSQEEYETLKRVVEILREGATTIKEIAELADLYYIDDFKLEELNEEMSKNERKAIERMHKAIEDEVGKRSIKLFVEKLEKANEKISVDEAKVILNETLEEIGEGPGKVLMPLRVVITGRGKGSELYNVVSIIGKTRTLNRINSMIQKYNIF